MGLIKKYFNWLQKDNPTGEVERYSQIDEKNETSLNGVFISGDLTGIPLLKLNAESGKRIIDQFMESDEFSKLRSQKESDDIYDIIIVGAGIAGVSAGLEAQKHVLKFCILESAQMFQTVLNFPNGKPIFAEPSEVEQKAELKIKDGTKESLLDDLYSQIEGKNLPVDEGVEVKKLSRSGDFVEVDTGDKKFKAIRVILAIGKSGNPKTIDVPGKDLDKVFNRLFDPEDAKDENVLVVGGGDSAFETAIATSEYAKSVTLSYRKKELFRPKEGNLEKLEKLVDDGKIKLELGTEVKEIKEDEVILVDEEAEEKSVKNSMVFMMIGRELSTEFFERSNIRMEGEMSTFAKVQFAMLILFSCVLYFGKASRDFYEHFFEDTIDSWSTVASNIFTLEFWAKFFALPAVLFESLFSDSVRVWSVTKYISANIAYYSFIVFVIIGLYGLIKFLKNHFREVDFNWDTFKYSYFIFIGIFFAVVFFGSRYFGLDLLGKSQGFWYTGFYSLTILIFGLRRIHLKPTRYIKYQTWALILIQALPLFILPEFVFPFLGSIGALGGENGFVFTQVFPDKSYWRSYGFILFWPLNFQNLYGNNITAFWIALSVFQTFVIIPYIIYRWGKGAYCGWICSCGTLAETLGDQYRTKAPHGPTAKKWKNFGQWALLAAFIITGAKLFSLFNNFNIPFINEDISYVSSFFHKFYYIGIDVIFAGVLGVGVYFFLSGRVWCRFGCPLAALMHIYNRFSRYRIFPEKKKCISCNICTKVCHMGIDVMNYANKGIPMNDVECVRCSACVVNCPTQVLTFGSLPKGGDTDNKLYREIEVKHIPHDDWRSGLS